VVSGFRAAGSRSLRSALGFFGFALGPLAAVLGAEALLFPSALGVQDVQAVDDLVLELLEGRALFVRARAEGRHPDVAPAVGVEHGPVHRFVQAPELDHARLVVRRIFEGVVGLVRLCSVSTMYFARAS
jgi:hypothetical protein